MLIPMVYIVPPTRETRKVSVQMQNLNIFVLQNSLNMVDMSQKPEEHIDASVIAKVLAGKFCQAIKRPEKQM